MSEQYDSWQEYPQEELFDTEGKTCDVGQVDEEYDLHHLRETNEGE